MKKLFVISLLALAFVPGAKTQGTTSYATHFPLTENPISEGGKWINGQTVGLDWCNVRTNGTQAYGTQSGSGGFNDSIALVGGTWGNSQSATATVRTVNQQAGSTYEEVELLLRFSINAHNAHGYECNFSCRSSGYYAEIVRWNGPLGNFTYLDQRQGPGLHNGDRVRATIVGNTITTYINDVVLASVTDSSFASGNPGIGLYLQGGTSSFTSDYGLTNFSASDGTMPPSAPRNLRILP
jgi:hypothetical protein